MIGPLEVQSWGSFKKFQLTHLSLLARKLDIGIENVDVLLPRVIRTLTVRLRYFNSVLRLFQIRSCDHELLASGVKATLNHVFKVVLMALFTMILAAENGIGEIDSNLEFELVGAMVVSGQREPTSI